MLCQFGFFCRCFCLGLHFGSLFGRKMFFFSNRCSILSAKLDKCHGISLHGRGQYNFCAYSLHFFSLSDSLRNHVPGQETIYRISRLKPIASDELLHCSHQGIQKLVVLPLWALLFISDRKPTQTSLFRKDLISSPTEWVCLYQDLISLKHLALFSLCWLHSLIGIPLMVPKWMQWLQLHIL